MGEQRVSSVKDKEKMNTFIKSLLDDVQALDYMLKNDYFENDILRIGAEQEMVMVDNKTLKPACIAMEVLENLKEHDWVETEISQFNLETTFTPREFTGSCFSDMEKENRSKLKLIQESLDKLEAKLVLTGILPTLRKYHVGIENLTPKKRYKALVDAFSKSQQNEHFQLRLHGIDDLVLNFDTILLEAVNTSFQVHLQVSSDRFVKMYNIAQAITGPVMAIAANSPMVFGKRLWHESRIAMFQQSLDTRGSHEYMREKSPRVRFGEDWLSDSILNIYKEDIARFRVLLSSDVKENSLETLKKNKIPKLRSLQVHNSTVYRWNRPCYGISPNGKPHLRIENRILPSGPTVQDEIANACFWLGLMIGMCDEVKDIRNHISFADVKDNFEKATRFGIDCKFTWFDDQKINAIDLVKKTLLPIAKKGLKKCNVDQKDINRYLGIIEGRVKTKTNGARWMLRSYTNLIENVSENEALAILTASIIKFQATDLAVHEWPFPKPTDLPEYQPLNLKVLEFMNMEVFTVHKNDILHFVMEIMEWRKIRYTPVENNKGELIGLVTMRSVIKQALRSPDNIKNMLVKEIMLSEPITIHPQESLLNAMKIMRDNNIGCLPVVHKKKLVGIITEMDFLKITGRLIERMEEH